MSYELLEVEERIFGIPSNSGGLDAECGSHLFEFLATEKVKMKKHETRAEVIRSRDFLWFLGDVVGLKGRSSCPDPGYQN